MIRVDWARVIMGAFIHSIEPVLAEENLLDTPLEVVLPSISFENALKISLRNEYGIDDSAYDMEISILSKALKDCISSEINISPGMTFRELNQAQVLLCVYNHVEELGHVNKMYFGLFVE